MCLRVAIRYNRFNTEGDCVNTEQSQSPARGFGMAAITYFITLRPFIVEYRQSDLQRHQRYRASATSRRLCQGNNPVAGQSFDFVTVQIGLHYNH